MQGLSEFHKVHIYHNVAHPNLTLKIKAITNKYGSKMKNTASKPAKLEGLFGRAIYNKTTNVRVEM